MCAKYEKLQNALLSIASEFDAYTSNDADELVEQSNDAATAFIAIVQLFDANNFDVQTLFDDALVS